MTSNGRNAETHLAVLRALVAATRDPARLVLLLAGAEDDADALRLLGELYGFTPVQARAVLDGRFALLGRGRRADLTAELARVEEAMAVSWDPPLQVAAAVVSPRLAVLVVEGVEHRVEGVNREDCLDRLVQLVRQQVAGPRRRRVAVALHGGPWPARIEVDPLGGTSYF